MVRSGRNGYRRLYFHHQIPQRDGALYIMSTPFRLTAILLTTALLTAMLLLTGISRVSAQDTAMAFTGEKTTWHEGFDRYDFLMDEQTFALTPIQATAAEKFGA